MAWLAACAALAVALAPVASFAQASRVEAVQSPAWLERGGRAVPLVAGLELQAQDKVITGGNARVRLALPEGSAVKLGENAQLVIERAEDRGLFRGALAVLAGAFRFTTNPLAPKRAREIGIKVKNVTVGVRGTDLWGKSTDERTWVVLIEGRIAVGETGQAPVTLERPNEMFQKVRDRPADVQPVDAQQVAAWAEETELSRDGPAQPEKAGGWRIVVAIQPTREQAREMARGLRADGFPADVQPSERYFAVHVNGLATEAQARAVMSNLRGRPGVVLPKVVPLS
jgi:hypothetical protein